MEEMSDKEFTRMFRMSKETFDLLLARILPNFRSYNEKQAKCKCGSVIRAKTRLAATLRFLAGGSYLDIAALFGVCMKTFHANILWPTIAAINRTFKIEFDWRDRAQLSQVASEFANYSRGTMTGCVMAIDGLVIKTRRPSVRESPNVGRNRNRKPEQG